MKKEIDELQILSSEIYDWFFDKFNTDSNKVRYLSEVGDYSIKLDEIIYRLKKLNNKESI